MKCSRCHSEAVITQPYSGVSLCIRHEIKDIESKAKKEIRRTGGLPSSEKIYIKGSSDYKTYALRIFLSELLLKRTDTEFVSDIKNAGIIIDSSTLDDTACTLFQSVLCGTTADIIAKKAKKTISPLSVIPKEEVYLYAKYYGWKGSFAEEPSRASEFIEEFKKDHPSALYALKNIYNKLTEEKHDRNV